ncbi:MAG: symmetrical bis(5'-nucleosyl)-tetraphosphatase [Gammaproteobacteria bacterium]|nr:MAG: symmetrical bis(5'-nucleosyl)-tetraphosphatase [Gammaproteobacteria bacterium]
MTTYAVGDLQGCLSPLQRLLEVVDFNPAEDQLWSVGDVVNRGPQSLQTLRFCMQLGDAFRMVLGNHDLHLLAVARGIRAPHRSDTLDDILSAPDRDELLSWLQRQPLLIDSDDHLLVHAGIPPQWPRNQALSLAEEMHQVLADDAKSEAFFQVMYGNQPDCWHADLSPPLRWRLITNYFTRMRFCSSAGQLELSSKAPPEQPPTGFAPWYSHPERKTRNCKIIFGHWAALQGKPCGPGLIPLDTGCVWGGPLRLVNLSSGEYHHCQPRV